MATSTPCAERTGPAGAAGEPSRLFGREGVIADVLGSLRAAAPPLTVVRGEAGVGRTALLDALRGECAASGARVLDLRAGEHDRATPYGALYRALSELDGVEPGARTSVLDMVAKLSAEPGATSPGTTGQLASAVFSAVHRCLPLALLIDDAQWLDEATTLLLEPLVRRMAGSECALVLTTRSDAERDGPVGALRRLTGSGMARTITLRPLHRRQVRQLIAESLSAYPQQELVEQLHAASRGLPAALTAGLSSYQEAGALRVVDRHAYLVPTDDQPGLPEQHPLLEPVRGAGPRGRVVARAMAVLAPLGQNAPRLVADALDLDEDGVRGELDALVRRRLLVRDRRGWRFRIPMVRIGVASCLGPYERRRLSAHAVAALWDGSAHADDPNYLPDRLVDAGKLVDPERAGQELLERGREAVLHDGPHAARWLRAAAERVTDPCTRATTLLAHSAACALHNRTAEAAESARVLLWQHAADLPADMLQEAEIIYLTAVADCGDEAELVRIAERDPEPVPGGPDKQVLARAFAVGLRTRWPECRALLERTRQVWSGGDPETEDFANIFLTGAAVLQGDTDPLCRFVADPRRWRVRDVPRRRFEVVRHEVDMFLALGEPDRALELLERNDIRIDELQGTDQFMLHWLRGDWEVAMDTARRTIAESAHSARPLGKALLHLGAAHVLSQSGRLSRARSMIELGRQGHLPYLFDFAETRVRRALGEGDAADELLHEGLHAAEVDGYEFGTEHMWAESAFRLKARGRDDEAQRALARLEHMSARAGTGRVRLAHLLTRVRLLDDWAAASEAVELARQRAQPYETALLFTRLAQCGVRGAELLPEAYELAGRLDALLLRSWIRQVMRACQVPVPSRAATTSENERLLAVLVTEGLSNRQLAAVFGATEKSVEGRLSRMFARIGYRSRVELAAAMLSGEYPG